MVIPPAPNRKELLNKGCIIFKGLPPCRTLLWIGLLLFSGLQYVYF